MTTLISRLEHSEKTWYWRGFPITYYSQGETGAAVLLIHGFGATWQHWRKNIPVLAQTCRVFAIDLIGFGGSAKPSPSEMSYKFETWGEQVADFCREVIGEPTFLVGNSIGCIVALQAAVDHPEQVRSLALLNCSLRLLHESKQATLPWFRRVGSKVLQQVLTWKPLGKFFFQQIANPKAVRNVLLQAYRDGSAVTDELVEILLKPARDAGAAEVFLAFTAYSTGPLAEDLLPKLTCPGIFIWGSDDPWEPIDLGRELANYPQILKFIPLEGVGHCPQDEAPDLVNPLLLDWIREN